jgi:hypothetical protein
MVEHRKKRGQDKSSVQTLDQGEFEARLNEHRGIVFKIANTSCPDGEERAASGFLDDIAAFEAEA